ncbi:MAG TPA: hypothetical protein DCZ95_00705 [Verrucomicrobia bacterium]|nr:hypothetical protein [Verrucomicrobiota bacterium]
MKKRLATIIIAGCACMAAAADEVVLFSAAAVGPEVWRWHGARLTGQEFGLILSRGKGDSSSVVLEERFARLSVAAIRMDVKKVVSGSYTLQLLAFKDDSYLGSVDLVKDSTQAGIKTFEMSKLDLPRNTETVAFKLWISTTVGSSVHINDLKYYLPVASERVLYDKSLGASTVVETDKAHWTPGDKGGTLALKKGVSKGSIVFADQIEKPEAGTLAVQVADMKNGTLAAQACVFDGNRQYLSSIDLVKNGTASLGSDLALAAWPEGAKTFQVKIWLGGTAQAFARIERILVLNRPLDAQVPSSSDPDATRGK